MEDNEIEFLEFKLNNLSPGEFVAWKSDMPTSHDGPGLTGSNYRPVYQQVTHIGEHEDEPVARLADHGQSIALYACETPEFVVISTIFPLRETDPEEPS